MLTPSRLVDRALELPVIPSFTRIGYDLRSRVEGWTDLDSYDLSGRTILITGATSGLGLAAVLQTARCGAEVVLVARDESKTRRVLDQMHEATGSDRLSSVIADLGHLDSVREAASAVLARHEQLDVLIHNAGTLSAQHRLVDGIEQTVASQVVGPFLLTSLLLPRLRSARPGRVVTMSSGGMYTAKVTVDDLQMTPDCYRGSQQYALAKRAQVTLNEMWADRFDRSEVVFHAMHPGWADTPGVRNSLPTFRRMLGPLLRTPAQGADTLVWLAADAEPEGCSGQFWLDRRVRPIHRIASTRRSDTPAARDQLWEWCVERSGANLTQVTP